MRGIAIISFVLLSLFTKGQTIAFATDSAMVGAVITEDTTYFLKNDPREGSWTIYYDSTRSQIAATRIYKTKDRYDYNCWYRNGQPQKFDLNNDSLPFYRQDRMLWYRNGQIRLESFTERHSSTTRNWWENGQLAYEKKLWGWTPWRADRGEVFYWHPDGVLYKTTRFWVDSTIHRFYYPGGALSSIAKYYPDSSAGQGSSCRFMQSYFENGKPFNTPLYPHLGRQPVTYFYPSGIKKAEGEWMEGNTGPYKEWYESGKLKCEGTHIVGIKSFPHLKSANYDPVKSGHWTYYNEAGWKEREEWYAKDGSMKFAIYNKRGKVISEGEEKSTRRSDTVYPEE